MAKAKLKPIPSQPRYPWDKWFARRRTVLRFGEDFRCQFHSMGIQIRAAAIKRGLHVSVFTDPGQITILVNGLREPVKKSKKNGAK